MFPFLPNKRLDLIGIDGQIVNNGDLFFEYKYYLTQKEFDQFIDFKQCFNHPDHPQRIITYVFNLIIMIFGKLMIDITKDPTQITMLCADMKKHPTKGDYIHFIIVARPNEINFLQKYLRTEIFHFSERLPNIPRRLTQRLRNQLGLLYKTAMKEYPNTQNVLPAVFLTILKKCVTLQEITPIMDILNFICSRVEDSVMSTKTLVRQIIQEKFDIPKKLQTDFEKIFEFFNRNASLFSTFQSNNRAMKDRQYQLFFFYLQYFCSGGVERLRNNPAFFFPNLVTKAMDEEKILSLYPEDGFEVFDDFIMMGPNDSPVFDMIFKKLFKSNIFEVNETFFEVFLHSLNKRFHQFIEEIKTRNPAFTYSFEDIIWMICVIMFNLVSKVFLAPTPKEASEHFRDKLGRYTPEQVALRVLELRVFKDIPLSDNNWQDYYLSRNKQYVKKIFAPYVEIPDSYFFSPPRLLKINIIYDRGLIDATPHLEQWIIKKIVKEFLEFTKTILDKLPPNFTKTDINNTLIDYFSMGIIDQTQREQIEDFVEDFMDIWDIV
jgi:hypothetical protein